MLSAQIRWTLLMSGRKQMDTVKCLYARIKGHLNKAGSKKLNTDSFNLYPLTVSVEALRNGHSPRARARTK